MNHREIILSLASALSLQKPQVKEIFRLGGLNVSNSQVRGIFVVPGTRHSRSCTDELLNSFLKGLIVFTRGDVKKPGSQLTNEFAQHVLTNCEKGKDYVMVH